MINFLVPGSQDFTIRDYLEIFAPSLIPDFNIIHYESLPGTQCFKAEAFVFSGLDQLTIEQAKMVSELHQQLQTIPQARVLNDPRRTLQRYDLLRTLRSEGRNDFGVARAKNKLDGLRFPVFLREESLHDGAISGLLHSEREIREAIGRALVQGHQLRDLLIVEFCDTADELGFYRKYAAFIVGDQVIPRSLNYGHEWMLKHSGTEFTREMIEEEIDYVSTNPHQSQLREIFKLAHVNYGRIDYALKDGRVQTWEINLHPTIGRGRKPRSTNISAELDEMREEVKSCFYRGFERAWREVNTSSELSIKINYGSPIESKTIGQQRRAFNLVKRLLRPVKPLLMPVSKPFLLMIGWWARASQRERG